MRANDAVVGVLLIVIAAAMVAYTATFPAFPGQRYGPALFPRLLGAGIILCGAALVVRGLAARRMGEAWIAAGDWTREPGKPLTFALVLACLVGYILVSESLGFIVTAAAILAVLFWRFQVRPLLVLPLAVASSLVVHWFFASLMRVPLPRGILDSIL
ncbi:tripartite tricarboxylate transporter TctB family protein [Salinarimonas soli]|uniref:Tripartite tricarboxylate transporter TctB family protein n=1 Tax=Salinarimonas soli TaxID=1638099 RepID=A0A5B2VG52_9HYPH|nr:tripartite tricarboxylate transporter TctB family protein [Salinarimonas soli]KAA2237352.1 tripartite tricarboxylate transporter TctB family protein [Salinarimonas soli]